jgi:hypothetical protein
MKHQINIACLFLIALACSLTSVFAKDAPTSAEQLQSELESALKAKDLNAVMSLFNWEGGSNDSRDSAGIREMMIRAQTDVMLKNDATNIKLLPLPINFQAVQTNEENGTCQIFNVNVVGLIDVKNPNGGVGQLPYGKKGDSFYLAGVVLEKLPGQPLYVRVLTGPNPDLLPYTGSWVYVKDGKEIMVNTSDKTNRFKICWGDYIKSCTIQRTSTNSLAMPGFAGWFYFQVTEGESNVFESPEMTNEEPVVYERK